MRLLEERRHGGPKLGPAPRWAVMSVGDYQLDKIQPVVAHERGPRAHEGQMECGAHDCVYLNNGKRVFGAVKGGDAWV